MSEAEEQNWKEPLLCSPLELMGTGRKKQERAGFDSSWGIIFIAMLILAQHLSHPYLYNGVWNNLFLPVSSCLSDWRKSLSSLGPPWLISYSWMPASASTLDVVPAWGQEAFSRTAWRGQHWDGSEIDCLSQLWKWSNVTVVHIFSITEIIKVITATPQYCGFCRIISV